MYKIVAKATLAQDQIKAKHRIGCDGIEIQLCSELLGPKGPHDWLNADQIFKLDKFLDKNIVSIHMPIIKSRGGDPLLECVVDEDDFKILDQVFYIANYFGEKENRDIRIVIHSESNLSILEDTENTWDKIVKAIGLLLDKYPRTILCIENVTPCRNITSGKVIQFANNFYEDNIEMCKALRKALKTDRVGVVLDICHQGITEKYMSLIYAISPKLKMPDFSIEHYVKTYAPYLKIIHLADFRENGYGENHGIPFEDMNKFNNVMDLICKYVDEDVYLTLEVAEEDYLINKNYKKQKQMVDKYFEEHKKP